MKNILLLIFLIASPFNMLGREASTDRLLQRLDSVMERSDGYVEARERQIGKLKGRLARCGSNDEKYMLSIELFDEYRSYINDSALAYMQDCCRLAKSMGRRDLEGRCLSLLAFQCSTVGMYNEAIDMLKDVDKAELGRDGLPSYYKALSHVYVQLGYYTKLKSLSQRYFRMAEAYRDTLYAVADKNSDDYLMLLNSQLCDEKKNAEALAVNDRWMRLNRGDNRMMAVIAFYRYLTFSNMGRAGEAERWLTVSAISDVENAVMDQGSLWELANILQTQGDIKRAYRYIIFARDCARTFDTRIRNYQISLVMPVIEKQYQHEMARNHRKMQILLGMLGVFALLLSTILVYVNKQRKHILATRNELKQTVTQLARLNGKIKRANAALDERNAQLQESNRQIFLSNAKLNEANRVKEEYIGRFFSLCSHYINNVATIKRKVNKMAKMKQTDEILKYTSQTAVKDKDLQELYANFDSLVLHLFPNFVDEFNSLLRDECRISMPDNGSLPTSIRIFALIRLGIDDSSKIAEFLHYSANTIYNYRARVKNGALGEREDFEKRVKELGLG